MTGKSSTMSGSVIGTPRSLLASAFCSCSARSIRRSGPSKGASGTDH